MLGYASLRHTLPPQYRLRPPLENPAVVVGCRPPAASIDTFRLSLSISYLRTMMLYYDGSDAVADIDRRLHALNASTDFVSISCRLAHCFAADKDRTIYGMLV